MTGDGDRDGPGDASPQGERDDRPELDVDAAFAALVAEFARPTAGGVGPWPASEDVDPDNPDDPDDADDADDDEPEGPARPDGSSPATGPGDSARYRGRHGPRHRLPDGSSLPADDPSEYPAITGGAGPQEWFGAGDADPERFVPPEAPPITSTDLVSRLAWLGVVGGPLFLLVAALVSQTLPTLVVLLALGAFIGGFVALVARLPRDRGDGGGDDGAVV